VLGTPPLVFGAEFVEAGAVLIHRPRRRDADRRAVFALVVTASTPARGGRNVKGHQNDWGSHRSILPHG
jgi:hypothetical protein